MSGERTATSSGRVASRAPARRMRFDATSLFLAGGVNAVLGLVFWLAATRLFPVAEVGRATTVINVATVLATIANLGMGAMYERFLPAAGRRGPALVVSGQALSVLLALLLAWGYVCWAAPADLFASPDEQRQFVGAVAVLAMFALQDSVLIGSRAGRWSAAKNVAHAVAKLLLVVVLAGAASSTVIVVAWILPAAVAVATVELGLFASSRALARRDAAKPPAFPPPRTVGSFYLTSVGWMLAQAVPGLLIPSLVAARLGLDAAAHFNIAWLVVTASLMVMTLASGPFVSEASVPGAPLSGLTRAFLRVLAVATLVRVVGVAVCGPIALWVYGAEYAQEGTGLLLIMAVVHLIAAPGYLYGALARIDRRIAYPMTVQLLGAVLVSVLVWLWLEPFGIAGVGWAYLAHDLFVLAAATPPLTVLLRRALADRR